jgi:hypothetical protein
MTCKEFWEISSKGPVALLPSEIFWCFSHYDSCSACRNEVIKARDATTGAVRERIEWEASYSIAKMARAKALDPELQHVR